MYFISSVVVQVRVCVKIFPCFHFHTIFEAMRIRDVLLATIVTNKPTPFCYTTEAW